MEKATEVATHVDPNTVVTTTPKQARKGPSCGPTPEMPTTL